MSPTARGARAVGGLFALTAVLAAHEARAQVAPPPPLGSTATSPAGTTSTPPPKSEDPEDEDSGRGLSWFWLEAQGGYEHLDLTTFSGSNLLAGPTDTSADGGAVSAGLGAQIVFLTLGARARFGFFEDFRLGTVGGELGFRIPLGPIEPRFDLGGGYAALGNFDGVYADELSIQGFYARIGAGLDFYPAEVLSVGAHASFDVLGLTRAATSGATIAALQEETSVGTAFALQGSAGLHF